MADRHTDKKEQGTHSRNCPGEEGRAHPDSGTYTTKWGLLARTQNPVSVAEPNWGPDTGDREFTVNSRTGSIWDVINIMLFQEHNRV